MCDSGVRANVKRVRVRLEARKVSEDQVRPDHKEALKAAGGVGDCPSLRV